MSAAFTPGPWEAHEDHPENAVVHVYSLISGYKSEVATLFGSRSSPMQVDADGVWGADLERLANARLIASAPERLEALKIVADGFARGAIKSKLMLANVDDEASDTMPITVADIVRAALAKALGEPQ